MSVEVQVTQICRATKTLTIEAYGSDKRRIFKSPMKYKNETKKHIESVLKKELKVFNTPIWGGFHIVYLCRLEVEA